MYRVTILALISAPLPASTWTLAKTNHFEIYTQQGPDAAREALFKFERLKLFFERQTGVRVDDRLPIRVIGFASATDYLPYRTNTAADGHYIGTDSRDYIVLSDLAHGNPASSLHEFAHLILHSTSTRLPTWLNEGWAELFSTARIGEKSSTLGGDMPAHLQALRKQSWIPLSELLILPADGPQRNNRSEASIFYAESWALTEMLFASPAYGPGFPRLMSSLTLGDGSEGALKSVYGKSLDQVMGDLHSWVSNRTTIPSQFDGIALGPLSVEIRDVSPFQAKFMLADLLAASSQFGKSEALYRELEQDAPADPDIPAALGVAALLSGDLAKARMEWKRAIDKGVRDATLCYRYAALATMALLSDSEIRPALERAIALRPHYDDALYNLALMEKNAQQYQLAIDHLKAMRQVSQSRSFPYWSALADAYNELGQRQDALSASHRAGEVARTDEERRRAAELAYISQTDMTVRFERDQNGRQQMVTTRIPRDTAGFNPFVEPSDVMRRAQGKLSEIDCREPKTRFIIDTPSGRVRLEIADPSRVQMRNAPPEFICGQQKPLASVAIDYAVSKSAGVDGIVRGIEFH